jgi:Tfp pilus assembly protein PilN
VITINLLPIGAFKETYRGKLFLTAYGIFVAILVAALFLVDSNVFGPNIESLKDQQTQQEAKKNQVKNQVAAASEKTTQTYRQWKQLSAIMELEERRRDQTRFLVEIDGLLPKSNAWLLSLAHNKGKVTLEGLATDKETVSQFLTRLEGARYIEKNTVILLEITQNMVINGIKLTKFKVTANTAFPSPTIMAEGLPDLGLPGQDAFLKLVEAAAPDLVKAATSAKGKGKKGL